VADWDTSPSHILVQIVSYDSDEGFAAWFPTVRLGLWGDGRYVLPRSYPLGQYFTGYLTPPQVRAALDKLEKHGVHRTAGEEPPKYPGEMRNYARPIRYLFDFRGKRTDVWIWSRGSDAGGMILDTLKSFTDDDPDRSILVPREIEVAVHALPNGRPDELTGECSVPSGKVPQWPRPEGRTLADLDAQCLKIYRAGPQGSAWNPPQLSGAAAQTIIQAADNDFGLPVFFEEDGRLYWIRWAPALQTAGGTETAAEESP